MLEIADLEKIEEENKRVSAVKDTVSACMIVKNEQDTLEDCLESIKDWVDEIIIVDTGSTDKTVEIAEKFGAKVFHQKWIEDFSFHRNYSISKATQEWVFVIDADERVVQGHGEKLRSMLPKIEQDVIVVNLQNLLSESGKRIPASHFKSFRFFRRSYGPLYELKVHNHPILKENTTAYIVDFCIHHIGYDLSPEKMAKKKERIIRMCRRWVDEEPDNQEALFHYARALRYDKDKPNFKAFPEVLTLLERARKLGQVNDANNVFVQILSMTAWIKYTAAMQAQGEGKSVNLEEIVGYAKQALAIKPDYLDPMLVLAYVYIGIDVREAEHWFRRYLRAQEAYTVSFEVDHIETSFANERIAAYQGLIEIEKWKEQQVNV